MQVDSSIVALTQAIAWPLAALIILLLVRSHVATLAKGAAHLNEMLGKGGDVATLIEQLGEVREEATQIKGMLETINIKDKGKELQELASQTASLAGVGAQSELSVEEMYGRIEAAWKEVAQVIRNKAAAANVKSNLIGTKGVSATMDALLSKGAVSNRAAELTKALSSQWQWIFRTAAPREEWLNQQVFTSFVEGADQAKRSLSQMSV